MDLKLSQLFWQGLGYLLLAALIGAAVFGIVMLIRLLINIAKQRQPKAIVYSVLMIVCIAVVVASWIFNIGWLRLILTFTTLPIVHAVVFAVVIGKAVTKFALSDKLEKYTILSCVTYVAAYLLLPDGGDYGDMYVFFALIHNNVVATVVAVLSFASFIANFVFLALSATETKKAKESE